MSKYDGMDEMQLEVELRACKDVLNSTDGQIVAALEGLLSCTSATAMTNYIKALPETVINLIAYRASIRQDIATIEEILENGVTGGDGE